MLLRPPVNVLRLFLHPAGLASRIVNLGQWRAYALRRLRDQANAGDDAALLNLLEEISEYPCKPECSADDQAEGAVEVPLLLATIDGLLSLRGTTTRFEAPAGMTADLTILAFHPADAATTEILRRASCQEQSMSAPAVPI